MLALISLISIMIFCLFFFTRKVERSATEIVTADPVFLEKNVFFYSKLSSDQKREFEADVNDFLQAVKITAVNTTITAGDQLLVAAGAVIPIFYFPHWKYRNLKEVLVYADTFNHDFQSAGNEERNILGMVGSGYMEGKMLLSKPAIEAGFSNTTDKNNTVIHEFVHLIDKSDGDTDGVPAILLDQQSVLPWVDMIHQEMKRIAAGKSDINPYAYTNQAEFFAVISEYFFERPDLLQSKHPELFNMLDEMFHKK